MNLFTTQSIFEKLRLLEPTTQALLSESALNFPVIPEEPGRDAQVLLNKDLPPKAGLSTKEGQARLLHDLANIELQAMELGLRTLSTLR